MLFPPPGDHHNTGTSDGPVSNRDDEHLVMCLMGLSLTSWETHLFLSWALLLLELLVLFF